MCFSAKIVQEHTRFLDTLKTNRYEQTYKSPIFIQKGLKSSQPS